MSPRDRDEPARRWAHALEARAIPERILDAAPEPPWGFPTELFRHRAHRSETDPSGPSATRALEALPDGGTVIDVGCGAGAASVPLARHAGLVVGVDPSADLLDAFREVLSSAGAATETVSGSWPAAGERTPVGDVVVCHHVLYNVQDIVPFLRALSDHARRRVVIEVIAEHPLAWMDDLWRRFHDHPMPPGPTADDLAGVLDACELDPRREERDRDATGGFARREDAVALVRRRLCLTPDRDDDVARALGPRLAEHDGRWSAGPPTQRLVTFWWAGNA